MTGSSPYEALNPEVPRGNGVPTKRQPELKRQNHGVCEFGRGRSGVISIDDDLIPDGRNQMVLSPEGSKGVLSPSKKEEEWLVGKRRILQEGAISRGGKMCVQESGDLKVEGKNSVWGL